MRRPITTVRNVELLTIDGAKRECSRRKWEDCVMSDIKKLSLSEDITSDKDCMGT